MGVNAVVTADGSGRITQFNPAAERTFGISAEEAIGQPFVTLLAQRCHEPYRLELDKLFSSEDTTNAGRTIELVGRRKDGQEFPLELCLVTWRSGKGALYTCVVRDISERKRIAPDLEELLQRVEAIARTDELTGMANRRAWDEELRRELARAARSRHSLCVVLIDLDHFKHFNDERGHQAGDALLRDAAIAWRMKIRVTDFIARYGGEEFALLLPDCPPNQALTILERLRAATPRARPARREWPTGTAPSLRRASSAGQTSRCTRPSGPVATGSSPRAAEPPLGGQWRTAASIA